MEHGLPRRRRGRVRQLTGVEDRKSPGAALPAPALQLKGITKTFGTARVLDSVDFDLRQGEIHALLGENGAGKSTLMNVLTGIYAADAGAISLAGQPAQIRSPAAATRAGIGMVHQHFRLVGPFTGRENLRLAARAMTWDEVDAKGDEQMREVGLEVPLDIPVARLSIAEQQRIEILKALVLGARILVLDEPTAVLTDAEANRLLSLMRELADAGHAIVFITHKLREVMSAGDRVSVLRRGRMVLSGALISGVDAEALSVAMIGESLSSPDRPATSPGDIRLELRGLSVVRSGVEAIRQVDLSVRAGEVLGLAGVGGNGQRELAEAILGLSPSEGQIWLDNATLSVADTAERRRRGMRYIPADRRQDALALNGSIADNLMAAAVCRGEFGQWVLRPGQLAAGANALIDLFDIAGAPKGGGRPVRLLSGGNAQKVVLARELDGDARLIVAHSPTQGLDVAAQAYVHSELMRAAANGAAVILISEDLEEILNLSDRIEVMSRGRVHAGPSPRPTRTEIGQMMLGHA